ncbi:MAG: lipoate--protein ligase family protein [Desulfuromonadales bacterium]
MYRWRLINSGYQTGAMNMALDEALLNSVASGVSLPVLRFYRWQPATVSLGYGQSVTADVDLDACHRAGLDVVRRSTGGRAVLHDHEVTYAVIAPFHSELFGGSVLDCYRVISEVLQQTLIDLGLPAQLVPGRSRAGQQNHTRAVCFSAPSQYELVVHGRKVVGSAQKRHGQAFLQHGSIPIELDLGLLGRILKVSAGQPGFDSMENVGWLNRWSAQPLTVDEIEHRLAEKFSQQLQIEWVISEPSADEICEAGCLSREKFGHQDWNMKR